MLIVVLYTVVMSDVHDNAGIFDDSMMCSLIHANVRVLQSLLGLCQNPK